MSTIANFTNTINNGLNRFKHSIKYPISQLAINVLIVLFQENYIRGFFIQNLKTKNFLCILLKYGYNKRIFQKMLYIQKTQSYKKHKNIVKYKNGLGIYIISTTKGLMTNNASYNLKLGGILLVKIY